MGKQIGAGAFRPRDVSDEGEEEGPWRSWPGRALQCCGVATVNNKVLFVALNAQRIIFRGHLT